MSNGQAPQPGPVPVPPAPPAVPPVPAPVPKTVYVIFSAEISQQTTESLLAVMANLTTQGIEEVVLAISTPGGDVTNGITLYNVLRGLPFKLTAHNVGNVDSIGNVILIWRIRLFD